MDTKRKIKKIAFCLMVFSVSMSGAVAGMVDTFMDKCEKGSMEGCYQAGVVYWTGEGAGKDIEAGRSLLQISCDGGFDDACVALRTLNEEEGGIRSVGKVARVPVEKSRRYSGYVDGKLKGDIDNDGKDETVAWRSIGSTELGDYYQLLVIDDDGSLLWEGPREKDEGNPYIFSSLGIGISMPALLIDFDQDGYVELLAPELQSDVRPVYYKKLRWRDTYFEALLSNALMRQSPGSDRFVWKTTQASYSYGTWIAGLAPYGKDVAKADVMGYNKDGGVMVGTALIRFDKKGATVVRWLESLGNVNGKDTSSGTASTQGTNTYRARLSYRDHQNSRGKRLSKVKDVLRQDRANLYKKGGDAEDQRDLYFHTGGGRNAMEHLAIHPVDMSYASMKKIIVSGTPLVEVNVRNDGLHITIIQR